MKKVILFLLSAVMISCGVCRHQPRVEYRDSIRVEYREHIIHDTATFEVPVEVEKIITRDTASHLENSFAKSDAIVSGGFLSHSLESKPQTISVPFTIQVTDTLYIEKSSQSEIKEVEIEKRLSLFQRFKIKAFWWLLAGFLILFVWTFRKYILIW